MSYTPNIFVDYNDLKKLDAATELLKDYAYIDTSTDAGWAMEEIRWKFLKDKPIKFKGLDFIILYAEFSSQVQSIRNKLTELGIEYALSY